MTTDLNLIDSVIEDAIEDIENSSVSVDDESIAISIKFKKSYIDLDAQEDSIAIRKTLEYIQMMSFGRFGSVKVLNEIETVVFDINATFSSYREPLYFLYLLNKAFSGSINNIFFSNKENNHILYPEQLHKTHDMFVRTSGCIVDKIIFNELWVTVIVPFYIDDSRKRPIEEILGENYRVKFLEMYDSYLNYGNYNKNKEIIDDDCLSKFIGMNIEIDQTKIFRGDRLIASFNKADTYNVPKEFKNIPTVITATRTFIRDKKEFIISNGQQPTTMLQTLVLLREPYMKGDNLWISYCSVLYKYPECTDDFSEKFWNQFSNVISCK